jgi:hypothetical protein
MHGLVVVKLLNPNIGVGLLVITTVRGNTKGWLSDLIVGDIEWHARSLIITNQRVLLTDMVTDKDLSGVDATVAGVLAGIGAAMAASLFCNHSHPFAHIGVGDHYLLTKIRYKQTKRFL